MSDKFRPRIQKTAPFVLNGMLLDKNNEVMLMGLVILPLPVGVPLVATK